MKAFYAYASAARGVVSCKDRCVLTYSVYLTFRILLSAIKFKKMASASTRNEKYLLLLDMNGTICYRSEQEVFGVERDLKLNRRNYYGRCGIKEFVQSLHETGKFEVCIYTSMMKHNAVGALEAIFPDANSRRMIGTILDRSMNKPDPEGENVRSL